MTLMSAAQRFHSAPSVGPMSGMSNSQAGAPGRPARNASSMTVRRWFTSVAPPGAARARGSTSTTAVSATIRPAAAPWRRCRRVRSHSQTGQVVNTRIAAHSRAEKNG